MVGGGDEMVGDEYFHPKGGSCENNFGDTMVNINIYIFFFLYAAGDKIFASSKTVVGSQFHNSSCRPVL